MSIHPQWLAKAETSVHYGTSSTISIQAARIVDRARRRSQRCRAYSTLRSTMAEFLLPKAMQLATACSIEILRPGEVM